MKIGSLLATLITTTGFALLLTPYARAATIYGSGPNTNHPVDKYEQTIDTHTDGILESFQLNIYGLELFGTSALHGKIRVRSSEDGAKTKNFTINASDILDGVFELDVSTFLGRERSGDYKLSLRADDDDDEYYGDEDEDASFDFTYWNVVLGTTPGTEACDSFIGTLDGGETWLHEACYNPNEALETIPLEMVDEEGLLETIYEEDPRFIPITSTSGVIVPENDDAHNRVIAYRQTPESDPILVEGSRRQLQLGQPYVSTSEVTLDFRFGGESCFLGNEQDQVIGITDDCRDGENLSHVDGTIFYDGKTDKEFQVVSLQGSTTGLPEAVPEPSLVLGLLSVLGIAGRTQLRRSK